MRAAAALVAAALLTPAGAWAVMPEGGGSSPGEPAPRVLSLEEQRALSRERQREAALVPAPPEPAAAPVAKRPDPGRGILPRGLAFGLAALALAGAIGAAALLRARARVAAGAGAATPASSDLAGGSAVESLWRKHLRHRR